MTDCHRKLQHSESEEIKQPQVTRRVLWGLHLLGRVSRIWKEWNCLDSPDNYTRQKASRRVTSCHWHNTEKERGQSICGSHGNVLLCSPVCEYNWLKAPAAAFLNPALHSQPWTIHSQLLSTIQRYQCRSIFVRHGTFLLATLAWELLIDLAKTSLELYCSLRLPAKPPYFCLSYSGIRPALRLWFEGFLQLLQHCSIFPSQTLPLINILHIEFHPGVHPEDMN